MGSRPIALAVLGRKTPNSVGLLPFSERSPVRKEVSVAKEPLTMSPVNDRTLQNLFNWEENQNA